MKELVEQQWEMNPYFQYFGGIDTLRWGQPCAATDLGHFRNRIGEEGIEKVLRHSIELHGKVRAAIEPIIGHIKKDHRAALNYLKGKAGDQVNFAMAASGFNYRKLMRKLRAIALWLYTKLVSNRKSQLKLNPSSNLTNLTT